MTAILITSYRSISQPPYIDNGGRRRDSWFRQWRGISGSIMEVCIPLSVLSCDGWFSDRRYVLDRPRRKVAGYQGQASWASSVINLVNTSKLDCLVVLARLIVLTVCFFSYRCRCSGDAPRHLPHGNRPRCPRRYMVRYNGWIRSISAVALCSILGERVCVVLCSVANHLSQRFRRL